MAHRVSRRQFVGLGIGAAAVLVLGACGEAEPAGPAAEAATPVATPTPGVTPTPTPAATATPSPSPTTPATAPSPSPKPEGTPTQPTARPTPGGVETRLAGFAVQAAELGPEYMAVMEMGAAQLTAARGPEAAMPGVVDGYMVYMSPTDPTAAMEGRAPISIMEMIFEFEDAESVAAMMAEAEAMTDQDMAAMGLNYTEGWMEVTGEVEWSEFDPGPIGDASYGWSFVLNGIQSPQGELPPNVTALHLHIVAFTRGKFMGEAAVFYFAPQPPDLAVEIAQKIEQRLP